MVVLPFIYFLCLFLYIYRKRGLDVSCCMVSTYLISSFIGIFLYNDASISYKDFTQTQLSILPTLIYCIFITIVIVPFYKFNSNIKRQIAVLKNTKAFNIISLLYIVVFFVLLVFYSYLIRNTFITGLAESREEFQSGEQGTSPVHDLPMYLKLIFYFCSYIGGGSQVMILFFLYSITFLNKSRIFNALLLISSLTPVIGGMSIADRSTFFFWLLHFIMAVLLFKPYLTKRSKKTVTRSLLFIGIIGGAYVVAVTIARFALGDAGASGGLIGYIGQSYLNFNEVWNRFNTSYNSLAGLFPLTQSIFHFEARDVVDEYMTYVYDGIPLSGFKSFLGYFLVWLGKWATMILPLIFYAIERKMINTRHNSYYWNLPSTIVIFLLGSIPQCGLFSYYYSQSSTTAGFLLFIVIIYVFKAFKSSRATN